jgi:hypothetical protein
MKDFDAIIVCSFEMCAGIPMAFRIFFIKKARRFNGGLHFL